MIDRSKCRQLPDGTDLIGTLGAAHEYKTTPPAFIEAAKKAGLKRYATRTVRGQVAHLWEVDAVEELARQRFANSLVVETDDIVEAPYESEGN
ncbi:hypothetical protein [Nocardioides sp.]|uniref:hypothetical protein n=1 Tax=Nocardioides sp. TaxID=35761 RepID=UPI00260F4E66|nr:hypothetical protein [Nocardioides sp.]